MTIFSLGLKGFTTRAGKKQQYKKPVFKSAVLTRELVGYELGHLLLEERLGAGGQRPVLVLYGGGVLLDLVAEALLVLVVLQGRLEQVAPVLVSPLPPFDAPAAPGDAVAPAAVPQGLLHQNKEVNYMSTAKGHLPRPPPHSPETYLTCPAPSTLP